MKVKVVSKNFKIKEIELKNNKKKKGNPFSSLQYMGLGYGIISPLLFCLFLGIYLKEKYHWDSVILPLIFLGFIVSLYNLFRLNDFKK